MAFDTPPVRACVRENQQASDSGWLPSKSLPNDPGGETNLHIVAPKRLLCGRELGLQLDNEQCSRGRMPRDQVDRSTFTEDRVRHFRNDRPSVASKDLGHPPAEPGVALVEEPVQLPATPTGNQNQIGVDFSKDPLQEAQ